MGLGVLLLSGGVGIWALRARAGTGHGAGIVPEPRRTPAAELARAPAAEVEIEIAPRSAPPLLLAGAPEAVLAPAAAPAPTPAVPRVQRTKAAPRPMAGRVGKAPKKTGKAPAKIDRAEARRRAFLRARRMGVAADAR